MPGIPRWATCCFTSPERGVIDSQQAPSSKVRYNSGDRAHGTAARSSVFGERTMRPYSEYGTLLRCALDFGERFSSLALMKMKYQPCRRSIFFVEPTGSTTAAAACHEGDAKQTGEVISRTCRKHLPSRRIKFDPFKFTFLTFLQEGRGRHL